MTKRMIDADKLLQWAKDRSDQNIYLLGNEISYTCINDIVNELATTDTQSTVNPDDCTVKSTTCRERNLMKTHKLKILPEYFNKILSGQKTCEIRKNDRGFKIGDTLHLNEIGTGNSIAIKITHIDIFEQKDNYVVLSFEKDPWCYDMEKAPYNELLIVHEGGLVYSIATREGFDKGNDGFQDLDFHAIEKVLAWMPIPEPKGGSDD